MPTLSYAILGTGALGGFYGGRLLRAGHEVHFLLRSDYQHVRRHGLRIDSKEGDFILPRVNAYARAGDMPACDVVVISLKTVYNHLLPELLPPLLKPGGAVLVLQNGLGVEEEVARAAGPHQGAAIIGGMCFLCSNKLGPGHICHLDYGLVTMAAYRPDGTPAGITPAMRRIAADFEQAGIPIALAEDLQDARWRKLVWNIPFNGLSVVLNAATTQIVGNPHSRALAQELMQEVLAGAAACGRHIQPGFIQDMLAATDQMVPYFPSMRVDHDLRRPLEVEAIFGNPLRAARQAGLALPRLDVLYRQLCFFDSRNRADNGALKR